MKPTPIEFAEWKPDLATLDTKFASDVENVFAGANSYLPFPSLAPFSAASLSDAGNDSFTKILLQFDGPTTTITDNNFGGAAHAWTAAGNATCSTGDFQFGAASLLCDGAGDWVTTPDHADFALGTSDFTVDFWIKPNFDFGQLNIFGQCDATPTAASFSIGAYRTAANKLAMAWGTAAGTSTIFSTSNVTSLTGWTHVALVRIASSFRLYINGVQEASAGIGGAINNSSNAFRIGALGEVTSTPMSGRIDGFRLSVGKARWTNTFEPPRVPYFNAGGRVCGLYSARTVDGGWKMFAGTTTKLFSWSLAGWVDISRTVGGAYNVAPNDLWMWEQSGDKVVAVNSNDFPQVAPVDGSSVFANLAGGPPKATNVKQLGDFLFLSGLAPGTTTGTVPIACNNRCIVWSGINDITMWQPGTNLCDMQEAPDGGPVQGVAGGEIGYAVQDRTIRTIQFMPGDTTYIFSFSRVLHDRGSVSKYGFASIGNVLYFVSEDGFYSISGQQVTPIGADNVNEWWLANTDASRRNVIHCLAGVNKPRMVWVMHNSTASPMYDREMIFDWSNGRWTKAGVVAQVFGLLSTAGLDLDTTGAELNDAWLDVEPLAQSLDSFAYIGGRPLIGAIDPNGFPSTLSGPNMAATLETGEVHLVPGRRAFVNEVYPVDDAASDAPGEIVTGTRERLQGGAPFWTPPVPIEQTVGSAFVMTSARLHRFRRLIPYASTWTHAQGVAVSVQPDGDGVTL